MEEECVCESQNGDVKASVDEAEKVKQACGMSRVL